jgi:benzoate-CoA ligase
MRELYNATVDLLERNLVGGHATRTYLSTRDRDFSYAEVAELADAAGAGLRDLGLGAGDRVLLVCDDCVPLVAMFWGAMKAGCVPVPLAPILGAAELATIARDGGAKAVLFDAASERAVANLGLLLIAVDETSLPAVRFDSLQGRLPTPATTADDLAFGLYTSGTTGAPKAVWHRHRSLRAARSGFAAQVLDLGFDDIVLSVSPMYFAYGLGNSVYLPAAFGAQVVVRDFVPTATGIAALIAERRVTQLFSVPSFYVRLLAEPGWAAPSLRRAISAGEALPASTYERFLARFSLPLLDGLGCTESMHHFTSNRPDDHRAGCAGRPLDGYEVEIRAGELYVRGPTIDDWLRTGDLAEIVDGRVRHMGRADDLFKLSGMWVAPTEIEDVLRSQPGVEDAAVVLVDDERRGPYLKAFVQSRLSAHELQATLTAACQARLPAYKVPRIFESVGDLPRTATGKLRRFALRRRP